MHSLGWVKTIDDLKRAIEHNLEENNGVYTVDEFLDNCLQHDEGYVNFGTRREHTGTETLRQFLTKQNFDFSKLI